MLEFDIFAQSLNQVLNRTRSFYLTGAKLHDLKQELELDVHSVDIGVLW